MTARCSCTKSRPWQCAAKRACICTAHTCEEKLGGQLLVIGGGIRLAEIGGCQDNVWCVSGVKKRYCQGERSMQRMSARRARMSAEEHKHRVEDSPARSGHTCRASHHRTRDDGKAWERDLLSCGFASDGASKRVRTMQHFTAWRVCRQVIRRGSTTADERGIPV